MASCLGLPEQLPRSPVFVKITNTRFDKPAYARLYISDCESGTVLLQEYIVFNCGAEPDKEVELQLWDPYLQAQSATSLDVRALDSSHTGGEEGHASDVRQRLSDSAFTLLEGHRVVRSLGNRFASTGLHL